MRSKPPPWNNVPFVIALAKLCLAECQEYSSPLSIIFLKYTASCSLSTSCTLACSNTTGVHVLQEAAKEHDSCTDNLYNALSEIGYKLADDPRFDFYTPAPFNLWYTLHTYLLQMQKSQSLYVLCIYHDNKLCKTLLSSTSLCKEMRRVSYHLYH